MVKMAQVLTNIYMLKRGAVERCITMAAHLQAHRGWQTEFVVGRNALPENIREIQAQGFPVHQIANLRKYIYPFKELLALGDLMHLFGKRKYDLVNTHWAKAGFLGRLAARLAGVPTIIHTVYGPTFASTLPKGRRWFFWSLEKLAAQFTDHFIFVGEELRQTYLRGGICTLKNSSVIRNARELSPFLDAASFPEKVRQASKQALGIDPQIPVIGYVARLVPSKGHIYAIQALRELLAQNRNHQAKLVFVGAAMLPEEKAFEAWLREKVKELGLEKEVIFAGWQPEPANFYGLFDIFVIPSLYEGMPDAVLEARAADLPVVGFDCGGVREAAGNANLVPVKDVAGLTRALHQEISRLPATRRRRGKNLADMKRLQERHSVARMLTETGQLYEKLLASHHS
jgi:glycosyltransferase involved in cell wall biosynthesis